MALFGRKNEQDATLGKPPMGWGVPGVQKDESVDPEMEAMLLTAPAGQRRIGRAEIAEAISILTRYKQGKASLEERVVQDELWWELRHWEAIRKGKQRTDNPEYRGPEPSSAWLFNAILNKHADAMDNYPEPVVLPRERSDEESAKVLSSVLPVILEYNDYEQTYSDNWWEKLKHGTAAYGVFWNSAKENGLGDVDIREIDLLKLFWEPGVTDIQKSRNLFIVDLVDEDLLEQQYPEHKGHLSGGAVDVKQYIYDDTIDTSNKSVVVDWYYKTTSASGKTLLHYAKFVGETLLFASENDPNYRDTGWYDHGLYPVVLDVMFPEKGTPVGFGYVAICKDPQLYIDKLSSNILENSMMTTKKRFFVSDSTGTIYYTADGLTTGVYLLLASGNYNPGGAAYYRSVYSAILLLSCGYNNTTKQVVYRIKIGTSSSMAGTSGVADGKFVVGFGGMASEIQRTAATAKIFICLSRDSAASSADNWDVRLHKLI